MPKTPLHTNQAPRAIGPYSQAVAIGDLVFVSGQIGLDPATGQLVEGGTAAQAKQVLLNLQNVLAAARLDLDDAVRTTVYLLDLAEFDTVNEIYGHYFKAPFPARATIGVSALPRGARVEIDLIAARS